MSVVAFLNQKGGVGKTSSVHHLAGSLAKSGRSVLIVDNDPQASLTQGLYGPEATETLPVSETIHEVYSGGRPTPESIIRRTRWPGLDVVPGAAALGAWNVPRPRLRGIDEQLRLKDFMDDIKSKYSVVLIDCAPNLHLCSWAALLAADGVVIPVQAEDYGAQGIPAVLAAVEEAREVNRGLRLVGVLITMFDHRTALARMYEDKLRERFGDGVFAATIPRLVDYAEAINARKPVCEHRPKGRAAERAAAVATELMVRINKLQPPSSTRRKAAAR